MLVSLRAQRVGALSTSSTQPPPCAPVRPPNRGDTFSPSWGSYGSMATSSGSPLLCRLATGWSCLAVILDVRNLPRVWYVELLVRWRSSKHSHPVPFLIRAKTSSLRVTFLENTVSTVIFISQRLSLTTFNRYPSSAFLRRFLWTNCFWLSSPVTARQHLQTAVDDWQW